MNPKVFTANFSDLGGQGNPSGIWSVSYLRLKKQMEAGAPAGQMLPSLYAWMADRNIKQHEVAGLLKLEPQAAYEGLCKLVNTRMDPANMPAGWEDLLRKLLRRVAWQKSAAIGREATTQQAQLKKFRPQAEALVASLLNA